MKKNDLFDVKTSFHNGDIKFLKMAKNMTIQYYEKQGCYNIKIGFVDKYISKDIIAIETVFSYKVDDEKVDDEWENTVNNVNHVIKTKNGKWEFKRATFSYHFRSRNINTGTVIFEF